MLAPRFSTRVVLDVDHYVPMETHFQKELLAWVAAKTEGLFKTASVESPLRDCAIAAISTEETHNLSQLRKG